MPYIIKTEINGIQEFIFNIKTKGAAKALKARSYLVDAACKLIEKIFLDAYPTAQSIYTGGGNVYLQVDEAGFNKNDFQKLLDDIAARLLRYHMQLSGCAVLFNDLEQFGEKLAAVNHKLGAIKLQFGRHDAAIFQPVSTLKEEQPMFQDFSGRYARSTHAVIAKTGTAGEDLISKNAITIGEWQLRLEEQGPQELLPLPVWTQELLEYYQKQKSEKEKMCYADEEDEKERNPLNSIISFECLAEFAKFRTGTNKIAVLKMDVDNLGSLFKQMSTQGTSRKLSQAFIHFFGKKLIDLLNGSFISKTQQEDRAYDTEKVFVEGKPKEIKRYRQQEEKHSFRNNIYTVYAGGDDCFFIGAWDALAEFAILLQQEFSLFEKNLRSQLVLGDKPITLSAAYIIVDAHYPVVRFAKVIEDALKEAKYISREGEKILVQNGQTDITGNALKNRISFMGHIFSWQELSALVNVKNTFHRMALEFNTPNAFYQRIMNAFTHADNLYWQHRQPSKPFNPAILWRFPYSFRDVRHEGYFTAHFYDTFFSPEDGYYRKYVWDDFKPGKELSAVLPVAARWTELLTRN